MNPLILFLAGGYGFFAGVFLLSLAWGLGLSSRTLSRVVATLSALSGVILIVASTTPIPWIWYGLLTVSVSLWIASIRSQKLPAGWRPTAARLLLLTIASGLILEVPYFLSPEISSAKRRRLVILADSITAGIGEGERTWPMRLRSSADYEIVDLSHVGAVVADGTEMIASESLGGDLVLIELGGNDLLGATPPEAFHRELDKLLQQLADAGCTVVMFELPLPPLAYQYGYSQRKLAARYETTLIPKRYLLNVLVGEEQTLDSIHLTEKGHQQMAELMASLLGPPMAGAGENVERIE